MVRQGIFVASVFALTTTLWAATAPHDRSASTPRVAAVAAVPCGSPVASVEGPAFDPENVCSNFPVPQVGAITNPAMQQPDQTAWQIFSELNQPVGGQPAWRGFPEQSEVYPANPNPSNPPLWSAVSGFDASFAARPSVQQRQRPNAVSFVESATVDPCTALANAQQEETRINKDAFDFIIGQNLWYTQGKAAFFKSGQEVNAPTTAREVKANWIPIQASQAGTFVTAKDSKGQLWGLVAMHFLSKEVPGWIWATFEHKTNPCYDKFLKAQDNFGLLPNGTVNPALIQMFQKYGLDTKVYSNYRLDGAQISFTDNTGRPIILGNSVTEFGFQTTASCMTCHGRATMDSTGSKSLSVFNAQGQSDNGTPDPSWYYASFDPETLVYLQTDFMWSIALCPNAVGTTTQNCPAPAFDQ